MRQINSPKCNLLEQIQDKWQVVIQWWKIQIIQLVTEPTLFQATRLSLPALARCSSDQAQQAATEATSNMWSLLSTQQDVLAGLDSQR
jgi:hypothetical protein